MKARGLVHSIVTATLLLSAVGGSIPTLAASSGAMSVQSERSSGDDQISFPVGHTLYIRPIGTTYEFGYILENQRYSLFRADRVLAVSQFEQNPTHVARPWRNQQVRDNYGKLESTTSWFFALTDSGLKLIQRVPGVVDSPFVAFELPVKSTEFTQFSSGWAMGDGKFFVLFSCVSKTGEKDTFAVRLNSNTQSNIKFGEYEVLHLNSEFTKFESGRRYDLKDGIINVENKKLAVLGPALAEPFITIRGKFADSIAQPPASIVDKLKTDLKSKAAQVGQALVEFSGSSPSGTATSENSDPNQFSGFFPAHAPNGSGDGHVPPPLPSRTDVERAKNLEKDAPPPPVSIGKNGESREITYKNEKFQIYNAETELNTGVFIRRLSDNTTVKISIHMVGLGNEGSSEEFVVKEGILSHASLARKIDLEKTEGHDFFMTESKFTPAAESKEISWADSEFQNVKADGRSDMKTIPERKSLIQDLVQNMQRPGKGSSILVGESGDKHLIIKEAIQQLPRTWRALQLDTGVIGSDIGISGEFEKKVKKFLDVSKTTPIVWVAEDFENFKGLGAVSDNPRDFLDLIRKEIAVDRGTLKILGTSHSAEDFFGRIKNPNLTQALKIKEVENLKPEQVLKYLKSALAAHTDWPVMNDDLLNRILELTARFRPVDAEPQRSIDLLEAFYSNLEISRTLKPESLTRKNLELAAQTLYRLDPALLDRKLMRDKLLGFSEYMDSRVIGLENVKEFALKATQTAMGGITSGRGPGVSIYVDGPPGTGKTEFVLNYAGAMGRPMVLISMDQFKRGSGNGINELLSQVTKALRNNSHSVILFDEIEKADPGVLEGLLSLMNNETYTYYEDLGEGQKRAVRGSAKNAIVFMTSNALQEIILEFYQGLDFKLKNLDSKELEKLFYKTYSKEQLEEMILSKGIPRPLMDRMKVRTVTFPASEEGLRRLMNLKIKGLQRTAEMEYRSKVIFRNQDLYLKGLIKKAMAENWSNRDLINVVESQVGYLTSKIYFLEQYEEGKNYIVDLVREQAFRPRDSGSEGGMKWTLIENPGKPPFLLNGRNGNKANLSARTCRSALLRGAK